MRDNPINRNMTKRDDLTTFFMEVTPFHKIELNVEKDVCLITFKKITAK
jgi:hypothetical protein